MDEATELTELLRSGTLSTVGCLNGKMASGADMFEENE